MTNILITESACDYIRKMIAKEDGVGFRLSIKKTGCSGYSYVPLVINGINKLDIHVTTSDIAIYLDSTWAHLLQDIKIDYIEEEKSGLKQKRLLFTNTKE